MVSAFLFSSLVLISCVSVTCAQTCLFNETMCTCAFGSSEGSCYERTGLNALNQDVCSKRACDAGWTCDCLGDFFCDQADIQVYTLIDPNDFNLDSNAPCELTTQRTITSSGFQLGFFHPQFSDNGLLAGQCQLFAWWLDGVLQNSFSSPQAVTATNLEEIKRSLSDWNNLPLRSGSVIGFRWRDTPYSCYNSISELNINGTLLDTSSSAVTHRFSNIFENDWFAPDFVEGSNWREPIASTTGDTFGIENTEVTNTYWRITVR